MNCSILIQPFSSLDARLIVILILYLFPFQGLGQPDLSGRIVDWSKAGLKTQVNQDGMVINILDYGGDKSGLQSNNEAYVQAREFLSGRWGTIYFPAGEYLFTQPIELTDSLQLKGEGATNTHLVFDLESESHLIMAVGEQKESIPISNSITTGTKIIGPDDISGIKVGDHIKIFQDDMNLVYSDWAHRSTGQMVEVLGIENEQLIISDSLLLSYDIENNPSIAQVLPVRHTGISCLSVERLDVTESQTSNIQFNRVVNGWIRGVESTKCNFAHVDISNSSHIEITGSYFHDAFSYGGGGKAYGVVLQFSSGNNLVENNIFSHLRHSILLQAGPSKNVIAYNYSTDPFWQEFLAPDDSAGELVLHGNYPYYNLFEGNMVQNAIVDNSHGENGPGNTFFRNRIEYYGFFMLANPASDQQNIVGNEITDTTPSRGFFVINGDDHFIYGNRVKGESIPENTEDITINSLYLKEKPEFFGNLSWPMIGYPLAENEMNIPARSRFESSEIKTLCDPDEFLITDIKPARQEDELLVYPNPTTGKFRVKLLINLATPATFEVYDSFGRLLMKNSGYNVEFDLNNFNSANHVFLLRINYGKKSIVLPVLKQ